MKITNQLWKFWHKKIERLKKYEMEMDKTTYEIWKWMKINGNH